MKDRFCLPLSILALLSLGTSLQAVTIYEDPGTTNSILFRDFTAGPGNVSFNNAQLQGTSGGGTTTYESNGITTDPQVTFGGGSLDLINYPNFRARYRITSPSGDVNAWRNPATGGQNLTLPNGGGSFVEGSGTIPNPITGASGFRVDPVGGGVGWTMEIDYIRADYAPTIGFEFDNAGDQMGLTINPTAYASSNFGNGSFSGQANPGGGGASDVVLNFPAAVRPNPDIYTWMEVRMKADPGNRIDLLFSNNAQPGITTRDLTEGAGPIDGDFHTYLVDLSDEADWSGTLDFLRFDPTNLSDANFEIDYIRFSADAQIPEPSSSLLALLAGLGLLRRRR